jgi:hypothetical protein
MQNEKRAPGIGRWESQDSPDARTHAGARRRRWPRICATVLGTALAAACVAGPVGALALGGLAAVLVVAATVAALAVATALAVHRLEPRRRAGLTVRSSTRQRRAHARRRVATSLVFAALFGAGASLSAVAGNTVASLADKTDPTACADTAVPPGEGEATPETQAECIPPTTTAEPEMTAEPAPSTEAAPEAPPEAPTAPEGETTAPPPAGNPTPPPADATQPPAQATPPAAPGAPPAPTKSPSPAGGKTASPTKSPSQPTDGDTDGDSAHTHAADDADHGPPVVDVPRPSAAPTAVDPEVWSSSGSTVWLHRGLPDPTPRAKRLAPAFAAELRGAAERHGVSWALVLGVVRAHGGKGRVPASAETLDRVAARLDVLSAELRTRRPWALSLAYRGRTTFADRATALTRYNRAVGLRGLVTGLRRAKPSLIRRVLRDDEIEIYASGREDIRAGRIDVRVLVLLRYLKGAHGEVTVSSLASGHRFFSRPGVPSAHVYGLAVDIAALGGRAITGNQQPGGITERAVRQILLLPRELAPQQVISLLGLGGPSFPMSDHYDHIHVGY